MNLQRSCLHFRTLALCLLIGCGTTQSRAQVARPSPHITWNSNLDSLAGIMARDIPEARFYMVGETHNFLANNDLMLALFRQLHQAGVYNVVNELPHATCLLFNEYLKTGDESVLNEVSPSVSYKVLKAVYALNQQYPEQERVKFFGIDYVSRLDLPNYAACLRRIRQRARANDNPLCKAIDQLAAKDSAGYGEVSHLHQLLASALTGDSAIYYRQCFGPDYNDLLLMSSNFVGWKGKRGRPESSIYQSFLVLCNNFFNKKEQPRFLAFYGAFHLNKLGRMLHTDKSSPVKDAVVAIGLQYYNCKGGFPWEPERTETNGVSFLYKKQDFELLINEINKRPGAQTGLLMYPSKYLTEKSSKTTLKALFLFKEYGDRRMHSWKFD